MGPTLTALVNLQVIEDQLRKARKRQKKGRQAIGQQHHHIETLEAALLVKRQEAKHIQVQAGDFELQLKTKDEEINKLRQVLNTAKSNKDYSAVLTQLNINKADKSKLEDKILAMMTQIDQEKLSCSQMQEQIEEEKRKLLDVTEKVNEKQAALNEEISRLEQQFLTASGEISDKVRTMFERLSERFDGEALAAIAQLNARRGEYGCGGCFMKIPRDLVNMLMAKDDVITCPSCGRILVLEMVASAPAAHND